MDTHSGTFSYRMQIRENHLDSFGHVNNATYLEIYEMARWEFITQNGYGLDEIMREQKGPVILEAQVSFRRELKNRDWIVIRSQIFEIHSKKISEIRQSIFKESTQELSSEAIFKAAFFDLKTRKLIAPTEKWLRAIGL